MDGLPTDLEILEDIYYRYEDDFHKYAKKEPDRIARIRVPIDVEEVAEACGVNKEMIFGRIFYHFNKKYSYKDESGEITTFFTTEKFEGLSVIFPLVASLLAEKYQAEKRKDTVNILLSAALTISVIAMLAAFFM